MTNVKTLLFTLLASTMLLAGCGGNNSSSSSSGTSSYTGADVPGELYISETMSVKEGFSSNISAEFTPTDESYEVDESLFVWTIKDPSIATITPNYSSCNVSGVTVGKTTLTVSYANHTANCEVEVKTSHVDPTEVTVYLVLSKVGLYEGQPGEDFEELFIENAIEFKALPETDLPGKDQVTTISSSTGEFAYWVRYDNGGFPTVFEKVPAVDGLILYAFFTDNGDTPGPGPTPEPGEVTYTLTNFPDWISDYGSQVFAWCWGGATAGEGKWYKATYIVPSGGAKITSATFVAPEDITGFLLARCHVDTVTPDWKATGDVAGRVYNKSGDVAVSKGTTTYVSPAWSDYNPQA